MENKYFYLTRGKKQKNHHLPQATAYTMIEQNICKRCGNNLKFTNYCNNCQEMGLITRDTIFFRNQFKFYPRIKPDNFNLSLTSLQKQASDFLVANLFSEPELLLWAVCGAGKTEITFAVISYVLNNGFYVAFAIPRIDILYEIADRLRQYFKETQIVILNSREPKFQSGQLYVMTTNQLLNFYDAFNLIIVDEADAFPFANNPKFSFAINNARRYVSTIVYLTATPTKNLNLITKRFIIYRRWHDFLLPIPIISKISLIPFKFNLLPTKLNFLLLNRKRQVLIFLSNITNLNSYWLIFLKYFPNTERVWANDPERRTKVLNFHQGKIDILLTTTILERGVTFPDIDVIVLDAENELYTVSNLVQIAGRVGRNINYQEGRVYFFSQTKTPIISKAINQIKMMNEMSKIIK